MPELKSRWQNTVDPPLTVPLRPSGEQGWPATGAPEAGGVVGGLLVVGVGDAGELVVGGVVRGVVGGAGGGVGGVVTAVVVGVAGSEVVAGLETVVLLGAPVIDVGATIPPGCMVTVTRAIVGAGLVVAGGVPGRRLTVDTAATLMVGVWADVGVTRALDDGRTATGGLDPMLGATDPGTAEADATGADAVPTPLEAVPEPIDPGEPKPVLKPAEAVPMAVELRTAMDGDRRASFPMVITAPARTPIVMLSAAAVSAIPTARRTPPPVIR